MVRRRSALVSLATSLVMGVVAVLPSVAETSPARRVGAQMRATADNLGWEAVMRPRRLDLTLPIGLTLLDGQVTVVGRIDEYVVVRDQARGRTEFITRLEARIRFGPEIHGPIFESWGPLDYTPAGRGAYYCAPYYERARATYDVALPAMAIAAALKAVR